MTVKICHLTTVHFRYDPRIFGKECRSLARNGYDVSLVVADGKGSESREGIQIVDAGKRNGRLARMFKSTRAAYEKALGIDAAIYHFHDPELLHFAGRLQKKGKKVIYDVHEDVARQLLSKYYLKRWIRRPLSAAVRIYEHWMARRFSFVLAATESIRARLAAFNANTCLISNYPSLREFESLGVGGQTRDGICYVGSITAIRGIRELVESLKLADTTLHLGGEFAPPDLLDEVKRKPGWCRVVYYGFVSRQQALKIYAHVCAGIVVLHPVPQYTDALPVKLFEYMLAGIPVVASDFPAWKEIIDANQCGLCVDPLSPSSIATAIRYLLSHPEEARRLGECGKRAVLARYNWEEEEQKLLAVYSRLLE